MGQYDDVDNPICHILAARLHRVEESIRLNQFLGSINVYKYGLNSLSTNMAIGHRLAKQPILVFSVGLKHASELIEGNLLGMSYRGQLKGPEAEFMNIQFSLRFLGTIWRVLRLEISVYNVCIINQFQTTVARGVKSVSRCE